MPKHLSDEAMTAIETDAGPLNFCMCPDCKEGYAKMVEAGSFTWVDGRTWTLR